MRVYGYFFDGDEVEPNYGIHEVDERGNAVLIKEQEEPPKALRIADNQEDLLDEEAIQRFRVDVNEVSLILAVANEDTLLRYMGANNEINPHKVYYYGKDLQKCFYCQDRAIDCLEYIAYQRTRHKEFAYSFIYRYLELRENPEADLDRLMEDASSQTMSDIQFGV